MGVISGGSCPDTSCGNLVTIISKFQGFVEHRCQHIHEHCTLSEVLVAKKPKREGGRGVAKVDPSEMRKQTTGQMSAWIRKLVGV